MKNLVLPIPVLAELSVDLLEFYKKAELKLTVKVQVVENRTLFTANISGDLETINFPEISQNPVREHGLWEIGCFELFVNGEGNSYTEYNFGFSRNYEIIDFTNYRLGQARPEINNPPKIVCEFRGDEFVQVVEFSENIISDNLFSLTAVVKLKDGAFLYFANRHCGKEANFHLESARELRL
jgi:hypothetical protein